MFGVSFTELILIGAVTLMVVGPDRLPKMLGTLGRWSAKLRRLTSEVRYQSGIDDILRKEGITGGLTELRELRNVARGDFSSLGKKAAARPRPNASAAAKSPPPAASANVAPAASAPASTGPSAGPQEDPFADVPYDRSQEYPAEGCDAYAALPDDIWEDPNAPAEPVPSAAGSSTGKPPTGPSPEGPSPQGPSSQGLSPGIESPEVESATTMPRKTTPPPLPPRPATTAPNVSPAASPLPPGPGGGDDSSHASADDTNPARDKRG